MRVHLISGDGLFNVISYDLCKKTICTRYADNIPFSQIRLIREVHTQEDKILEKAIRDHNEKHIWKLITIPKKAGGVREVYTLEEPFNTEQKRKVKKLRLKMKSVKEHAFIHKGAKTIISMDIEKAFPSVILGKHFTTDDKVLMYSFNYDKQLMQGTPCSSWIFEEVMSPYFKELEDTLVKVTNGLVKISRYVDDITISSHKYLKAEIVQTVQELVETFLDIRGFRINSAKSRVSYENASRFKVLGIALAQDRVGVRNMKKQAILYWKKGEIEKCNGMLSYLKQFLCTETYERLKLKFAGNYIEGPSEAVVAPDDLPF